MIAALMSWAMTWAFVTAECRRTTKSGLSGGQQLLRLAKSGRYPSFVAGPFGLMAVFEVLLEFPTTRGAWWLVAPCTVFVVYLGAVVVWRQCVLSSALRLLTISPARARAAFVPAHRIAIRVLPTFAWAMTVCALLDIGASAPTYALTYTAYVVVVVLLQPALYRLTNPTRKPSTSEQRRLDAAADRFGLDIAGIRVVSGEAGIATNAGVTGVRTSGRNIVVTAQLLQSFDGDDLAAVLAHEVGHRDQHHILRLVAAESLLTVALVVAGVMTIRSGSVGTALAGLVLVVDVLPRLRRVVASWLSRRFEHAADAFAARRVGAWQYRRMLINLGKQLDESKLSGWGRLTRTHPEIGTRIARCTPSPGVTA